MRELLKKIQSQLDLNGEIICQFDDDDTTICVTEYFRYMGYKVEPITASAINIIKE